MALSEKNKQIVLASAIGGIAVFVILVYVHFFFVKDDINSLKDKAATLKTETEANKIQLDKYKKELDNPERRREVEARFYQIEQRLPSDQDTVEVYDILRGYFKGSAIVFTNLERGQEKRYDRYAEYPFTIKGRARYHQVGQLVNLIECNPERLMHVTMMDLTNNDRRPSVHPMEIGVSTFTFNEDYRD